VGNSLMKGHIEASGWGALLVNGQTVEINPTSDKFTVRCGRRDSKGRRCCNVACDGSQSLFGGWIPTYSALPTITVAQPLYSPPGVTHVVWQAGVQYNVAPTRVVYVLK